MSEKPPGLLARGWARVRDLGASVLREHASPSRLALAVGVGALAGSSPLVGLHALVAVGIASLTRLNRVAAFAGSNVSIGPMMPLLFAAELAIGSRLLGIALPTTWPHSPTEAFSGAAKALWIGWLFVGTASAALLGGITYVAARARDRRAAALLSAPADPPASA